MHNPESVLENETHKLLRDFEIKTDHLIPARQPDLVVIHKEKMPNCGLGCPNWPLSKIERKRKEKLSTWTYKGIEKNCGTWKWLSDTNCNWCSWYSHQRISTMTGKFGNKRTLGNHSPNSNAEIGKNTEKSPGDLRKLAVTQTQGKTHFLTLVWQNRDWVNNNNNNNNNNN